MINAFQSVPTLVNFTNATTHDHGFLEELELQKGDHLKSLAILGDPYIIKWRKAGFGMPIRSIFSERKKVDDLLDTDFFESFEGFSVPDIQRINDENFNGVGDNLSIIFALISFQKWHQKYIG